ncbi:MAG: carboxypeptidase-like regulatory domain-containing protein, partial [Acidobacteriota bacterium]|nr:carboxypeptidase-like regulatory domain-containing protein [Acidobacteriota bacterium]
MKNTPTAHLRPARRRVAVLTATCLLLAQFVAAPRRANAQDARATLRIGEANVLRVGQRVQIMLVEPATGKQLDLSKVNLVSSDPSVVAVAGTSLVALQPSPGKVQLLVRTKGRRPRTLLRYELQVVGEPAASVAAIALVYDPPNGVVQPGGLVKVTAVPRDSAGNEVRARVRWTLEDFDASNYVEWATKSNNQILIFGKPEGPAAAAASRPNRLLLTASAGRIHRKGYVELKRDTSGTQTHTVSGRIVGDAEKVKDVIVTLTESGSQNTIVKKTDGTGTFTFDNLPTGRNFTVTPSKEEVKFSPATQLFAALKQDAVSDFVADDPEVGPTPEPIFKTVRSQLDNVDDRTAADLFGNVTNSKYHITKLQLFNNLHELRDGRLLGDSIVVYSDSIRVPVNYEVRYVGPDKNVDRGRREWHPKVLAQLSSASLRDGLAWNKLSNYRRPRRRGGDARENPDPLCPQEPDFRSPYTFDQMLRSVDQRDSKEWRTVLATVATGTSSLASYFLSFIEPTGTSDARAIVQNFNSLLIPSFKEHLPSKKELHRESITKEAMRPSETIPFKQDISRIIFLPKEPWRNGEYEERISRVCLEPIKVDVVVARPGDQLPVNTLVGRVEEDGTGKLVANATVEIKNAASTDSVTTDSNGIFTFQRLFPGDYVITVTTACGVKATSKTTLTGSSNDLVIKVQPRFRLGGTVKDNAGSAVKDARVDLKSAGAIVKTATTGVDGSYVFDCLPKGPYTLTVTHPQHTFEDAPLAELGADSTTNITAKPPAPAPPSGTSVDSPASPVTTPVEPPAAPPAAPPGNPPASPPEDEPQDVVVASEVRLAAPPEDRPGPPADTARPTR